MLKKLYRIHHLN